MVHTTWLQCHMKAVHPFPPVPERPKLQSRPSPPSTKQLATPCSACAKSCSPGQLSTTTCSELLLPPSRLMLSPALLHAATKSPGTRGGTAGGLFGNLVYY